MKNSREVLILGKGYMGERLSEALDARLSSERISTFKDVERLVEQYAPKILINCIGTTGARNVDDCEQEQDKTLLSNTYIPILLGEVALRRNIKLVHISSGCIYHYDYGKDRPLREEQVPDFFDLYYSRSKIYSEMVLERLSEVTNILIPRIRIPLDDRPHRKNVLTKLIAYKKVIDLPNSVTYVPDFIEALQHLLDRDARGVYNVVNEGGLSYPVLLDIYKKHVGEFDYSVVNYNDLNLVRTNLILSAEKLRQSGFRVRPIQEVLEECVKNYLKY